MAVLLEKEFSSDCDKMSLSHNIHIKNYFLVLLKKIKNSPVLFLIYFSFKYKCKGCQRKVINAIGKIREDPKLSSASYSLIWNGLLVN